MESTDHADEQSAPHSGATVVVAPRTINPHRSTLPSDEAHERPSADEPPTAPFLGPEGMFRAGIAIACAPIIISVVWAIATKEWFAGDRSIMGVFTHDVFTKDTPLLGTVSTMGNYTDAAEAKAVHHLGPAQFWALSIPNLIVRGHPVGLLIGAMLINCGAVVLTAVYVRRRLGTLASTGFVLVMTILAFGLGPSLLRDVWTPFLGLWPLLALVVLTWSLIDGDERAMPWAAFVSGFLAQIELMFVGPAAVLVVAGLVGFGIRRRADQRAYRAALAARGPERSSPADRTEPIALEDASDGPTPGDISPVPERPAPLGWVILKCEVIALFMWWPVLYQELTGDPGNITLLIRAIKAGTDKAGATFVSDNMIAQLQAPPVWIRRASSPLEIGQSPTLLAMVSAALVAVALVALTASAWRRRDREPAVFTLLVTTYPILIGAFLNLSITPEAGAYGLQYRRWLWPFGAFIWFALIVGALSWAKERSWSTSIRTKVEPATAGLVLLGLAALAVIPASMGQLTPPSDDVRANKQISSMWHQVRDGLPDKSTYLAVGGADAAFGIGPELMRRLVVEGRTMRTSTFGADSYGDHRVLSEKHPADQTLQLITGNMTVAPPDTPQRLLGAGTVDGSSSDDYVEYANEIMEQVRGGPGFVLDDEGFELLYAHLSSEGDPGVEKVQGLIDDPTRAIFAAKILQLQLEGRTTSSPITDEQATELLAGMSKVGALAFLREAPEIPKS